MSVFELTVLGARGSIPVGRADCSLFGGDTSCYMVRAGEETIFLDAGTGLVHAPAEYPCPPSILLSHLHLDHVMGLGMFPGLTRAGTETRVYIAGAAEKSEQALLNTLWAPPFWPVRLSACPGILRVHTLSRKTVLGEVTVETAAGSHPGEAALIRLTCRGRRIVYATDFEGTRRAADRLAAFAEGADLLMFDGQYTKTELARRVGFGHSTPEIGQRILTRCGGKSLLLIHHDPHRSDAELLAMEQELGDSRARFAREGEVISL